MTGTKTVRLPLPEEKHRRLKAHAALRGSSVRALLREQVDVILGEKGQPGEPGRSQPDAEQLQNAK